MSEVDKLHRNLVTHSKCARKSYLYTVYNYYLWLYYGHKFFFNMNIIIRQLSNHRVLTDYNSNLGLGSSSQPL